MRGEEPPGEPDAVLGAGAPKRLESFIITPYYSIIGGWVTKYTAAYLINGPAALADGGNFFGAFITSDVESFFWMLLFMAFVNR